MVKYVRHKVSCVSRIVSPFVCVLALQQTLKRINLEAENVGKGGDSSASGTARGRSGRETKERARVEEREMEPVSTGRNTAAKKSSSDKPGAPKGASASRSSSTRRNSAASTKSAATKRSGTSSGRSNTSGSSGRSASGR